MPLQLFDAIDPATLTGYVRGAADRNNEERYVLEDALPDNEIDDLDYQFNRGGAGLLDAAVYRAYGTEAPIGSTGEAIQVRGELPPISEKLPMAEYERLRMRRIPDADMRDAILGYGDILVRKIQDRVEAARSEVLRTGELNLSENGVVAQVQYGRDGNNSFSAGVPWATASTADPFKDLVDAAELISDNGGSVTDIVMTTKTLAKMKATDALKSAAVVGNVTTTVVPTAAVSAILTELGLPEITLYDKRYSVGGSPLKFVPDDYVYVFDRNGLGSTPWGVTAEQLEFAGDGQVRGGGIFAMTWKAQDPVTVWTKASAITLPVLTNPNLSACIDVS